MGNGKYESHIEPKLPLIQQWARDGLTLDQIASNLQVSKTTLIKHRGLHPELLNALKEGKEVADAQVVNKLYQSAVGFYYKEQVMAASGEIKEIERYAKPNMTAVIFWLKNRQPSMWREKQEVKHEVTESLADLLTRAWNDGDDEDNE